MKIAAGLAGIVIIVLACLAYYFLAGNNQLKSDEAKSSWLTMCDNNSQCIEGVNQHYDTCVDSIPYEMPSNGGSTAAEKAKLKRDKAEFFALVEVEISTCLTDKTGIEF